MSGSAAAWTAAGAVLTIAAVLALARRARLGCGPACWWLAGGTLLWGAAFAARGVTAGQLTPAIIELTLSDLLALCGLALVAVGLLRLGPAGTAAPVTTGAVTTGAGPARPGSSAGTGSAGIGPDGIGRGWWWAGDAALTAIGLLAIGWILMGRPAFAAAGVGAGTFAVVLIHPLAGIAVLGAALWPAARAGRAGLIVYAALLAAAAGDFLAVQARAGGTHPGSWAQLAWLASIVLAGAAGVIRAGPRPSRFPAPAALAVAAAGAGGAVTLIFSLLSWDRDGALPLVVCAVLVLALAARVAALARAAAADSARLRQAAGQFHQLADRTSDVVLLCDPAGAISYASKAVAGYGYAPAALAGTRLPDLIHPDDLAAARRAAADSGELACRVRAADGTWRHVQGTVSRYAQHGGPAMLLVTARDVSDQVALRQQVTQLTFHDGLTGLPNRAYVEVRAKEQLPPAAIFADLDGFTAINDSVGHGAGDLVLAQAGRRMRAIVPAHHTVARWGGDEFAVLVEHAASPQEIVDIAERLARAVAAEPFEAASRQISITASVGVAFAGPGESGHLLRNADLAMSRAKDAGGGRVELFAAHMHADVIRRIELASALRGAIEAGTLGLEYQPVVELTTSRVASVEALVRWSAGGEQIAPAEFLDIAEDTGLIVPLGSWVLATACQQVARWRQSGWPVGLSVNFSHRQVSLPDFPDMVLAALDSSGLARSALTLEVTERALIEVGDTVMDGLTRLRALGVRLAIDDFGTGYASLAYLRELPVDIIKIDPSFVAGLGTDGTLAMLTRTIVQVGHDLGIEIVAEGIERPEQLELLRAMGCGLGQGFLMARPMPAQRIESLAVMSGAGPAGPAVPVTAPGAGRAQPPAPAPVAPAPAPGA